MLPSYGINFVLFLFKSFSFLLPFFFLSFPFPDTTETMAECLCVYNTKKKKKKVVESSLKCEGKNLENPLRIMQP